MSTLNENELKANLAKGDFDAFTTIVLTYKERLQFFSMHYLNDQEMARDIVQDVFLIVWEDPSVFAKVNNLSSWLFTLTKNQCLKKIDHLKVRQKHRDDLKYRQLALTHNTLGKLDTSPIIFEEISTIVEKTLAKLPTRTRHIFEMSRFENKKNWEIAMELNISIKTVEANITKTLKLLRPILNKYLPIIIF